MAGTAPADADLLDDADTETAAAVERSGHDCIRLYGFLPLFLLSEIVPGKLCRYGAKEGLEGCELCSIACAEQIQWCISLT